MLKKINSTPAKDVQKSSFLQTKIYKLLPIDIHLKFLTAYHCIQKFNASFQIWSGITELSEKKSSYWLFVTKLVIVSFWERNNK